MPCSSQKCCSSDDSCCQPSMENAVYDKYGGLKGQTQTIPYGIAGAPKIIKAGIATGFFHIETFNGKKWIVTPDGNPFISKGMDGIRYGDPQTVEASTYNSPFMTNVIAKYGTLDNFFNMEVSRLINLGFNTAGGLNQSTLYITNPECPKLPYCINLNILPDFGTTSSWIDFFVRNNADTSLYPLTNLSNQLNTPITREKLIPFRDDPYLVGIFFGVGGCFGPNYLFGYQNMLDIYLTSTFSTTGGRGVMMDILSNRYGGNITLLNNEWGTTFANTAVITTTSGSAPSTAAVGAAGGLFGARTRRLSQYSKDIGNAYTYLWVQNHMQTMDSNTTIAFATQQTGNIVNYNNLYNTVYPDFTAMVNQPVTSLANTFIALNSQATRAVAKQYFSVLTTTIDAYDDNHMLLGVPMNVFNKASIPPEVLEPGVINNVNILCINGFVNNVTEITGNASDNLLPRTSVTQANLLEIANYVYTQSGNALPVMYSQVTYTSKDSGLLNNSTQYKPVTTQVQRANAFVKQIEDLVATDFGVGYCFNGLVDQNDGANGAFVPLGQKNNIGLVDKNDNLYANVAASLVTMNANLESLHLI
jgi:hypothetical protein